jgi:hypothetical protein
MELKGKLVGADGQRVRFNGLIVTMSFARTGDDEVGRELARISVEAAATATGLLTFDFPEQAIAARAPSMLTVFTVRDGNGAERGIARLKRDELIPLLRAQTPVEIAVTAAEEPTPRPAPDPQPEPQPRATPIQLRGKIEIEGQPGVTTGFDGYRVDAAFTRRDDVGEGSAAAELADGNAFVLALPDKEKLAEAPVKLTARYPDGRIAGTASVTFANLAKEAVITIAAANVPTLTTDPRAAAARPEKLKGKVIQFDGAAVRNRQVAFWAISDGEQPSVFLVTQTDSLGGFSVDRPKQLFGGVIATVSGTANSRPETAVAVALEGGAADTGGRLPPFVYLVVDSAGAAADEDDCDCGIGAPRLPDQDELVSANGAYSQDIGGSCTNFTIPNRTLEEFTYSMAVRTSEPLVKGTTLSNIEQRDQLWHKRAAELIVGDDITNRSGSGSTAALPMTMARETSFSALSAFKWNFEAVVQLDPSLFQMFNGRGQLNASNAVDWDSEPTFYQATTIAHGHILYFKQVWKADGYSLGDLLYSLPLAPGQKKQIVVFDWDRTEFGRRDEASHADESLDAYLSHNRDILDITQGSVSEQMRGGSRSKTSGEAGGIGAGVGALLGPVFIGVAGGYSASSGSSSASAWQDSSRNTSATGLSQLRDNIQQGASSVRNQRATVVQTARQAEQFRVETEVVANHNHCHAITIQYFEVLRHYVIEQKLSHVQECLFVPLLMSPFTEEKVIRWMDILRATLRDPGSRSVHRLATGGISYRKKPLAEAFSAIERRLAPPSAQQQPVTTFAAEKVLDLSGDLYIELELNRPEDKEGDEEEVDKLLDAQRWNIFLMFLPYGINELRSKLEKRVRADRDRIFQEEIAPEIAQRFVAGLKFAAIDRDGNRHDLDLDATLVSRYARSVPQYVSIRPNMAELPVTREQIAKFVIFSTHDLTQAARSRVVVRRAMLRYRTQHYDGTLIRNDAVNNDLKSATIDFGGGNLIPSDNVVLFTPLSSDEMRNPKKEDEELVRRLLVHLNGSLEYYHRSIWQRMDPQRRFMLLDGFIAPHSGGKSVASVVENRVIGIAGNSLIMPVAPGYKLDPSYQPEPELDDQGNPVLGADGKPLMKPVDLLSHYEPTTPIPPYRISVPTRGVFAEAVMGACNSCEKKDDSRFWRWEESPNPDQPTAINPIGTNPPQRSDPGELNPTPFPAPIIAMQNAPAAPNPGATLEATMALLGKSGLFPDITGLSETQKNSLQAMLSNQESAKHFADKAAELATLASAQRGTDGTIDTIKKAQADNLLDEGTAKKLTEESIRAKINGRTTADEPDNTAKDSDVGKAAAKAVEEGRPVNVSQTHPDGTSTVFEGIAAALGSTQTSAGGGKASPWKHLTKATVLSEIEAFALAPDSLDQGALGLCGEAAFLRHVIQRKPDEWRSFAKALYSGGTGFIGQLKVSPDSDLMNADWPAIKAKHPALPAQASWMAMSALRDSENDILDFEGTPEETVAIGSFDDELEKWYNGTKFWSTVTLDKDKSQAHVLAAGAKAANQDIVMGLKVELIDPTLTGNHAIALESPISFNSANGTVSFTYWSWARGGRTYSGPIATFLDKLNYLIIATV